MCCSSNCDQENASDPQSIGKEMIMKTMQQCSEVAAGLDRLDNLMITPRTSCIVSAAFWFDLHLSIV